MQMLLKGADIGHLAAAPALHQRWAYQLEEEFFRQGDEERGLGLPVSPLMDRNLRGMTKTQITHPTPPHLNLPTHSAMLTHWLYSYILKYAQRESSSTSKLKAGQKHYAGRKACVLQLLVCCLLDYMPPLQCIMYNSQGPQTVAELGLPMIVL